MSSFVELRQVSKSFGDEQILQQLDLVIDEGEFVVIVGPSGCGKSTTLRIISGLENVSAGSVFIAGKDVTSLPPKQRSIAMVFQSYALYPHMNVAENMSFALRLAKVAKELISSRVTRAAKILDINTLLERKPRELSGGQRQRVATGRAITRDASCFLFDEPLSNLDAKLRTQMRTELLLLHKRLAKTMIFVTHDQIEAMTMADRIVVMSQGEVQQIGTPREVYNEPANLFVAKFIGSPAMNIFSGEVIRSNGTQRVRGEGFDIPLPPLLNDRLKPGVDQVLLGLRPEHFSANNDTPDYVPIDINVSISEYTGANQYLACRIGGKASTITINSTHDRADYSGQYWVDSSRMYFFDPDSEESLLAAAPTQDTTAVKSAGT